MIEFRHYLSEIIMPIFGFLPVWVSKMEKSHRIMWHCVVCILLAVFHRRVAYRYQEQQKSVTAKWRNRGCFMRNYIVWHLLLLDHVLKLDLGRRAKRFWIPWKFTFRFFCWIKSCMFVRLCYDFLYVIGNWAPFFLERTLPFFWRRAWSILLLSIPRWIK